MSVARKQKRNVKRLRVYEKALEYADLKGGETVIDAYCGTGTISLCLAKKAKQVIGIEIEKPAIEDAKKMRKRTIWEIRNFTRPTTQENSCRSFTGKGWFPM